MDYLRPFTRVAQRLRRKDGWDVVSELRAMAEAAGIETVLTATVIGHRYDNQGTPSTMPDGEWDVAITGWGKGHE